MLKSGLLFKRNLLVNNSRILMIKNAKFPGRVLISYEPEHSVKFSSLH